MTGDAGPGIGQEGGGNGSVGGNEAKSTEPKSSKYLFEGPSYRGQPLWKLDVDIEFKFGDAQGRVKGNSKGIEINKSLADFGNSKIGLSLNSEGGVCLNGEVGVGVFISAEGCTDGAGNITAGLKDPFGLTELSAGIGTEGLGAEVKVLSVSAEANALPSLGEGAGQFARDAIEALMREYGGALPSKPY